MVSCSERRDAFIAITNMRSVRPLDPFWYPSAVDAFGANERVAVERDAPRHRTANVGPQRRALDTNDGVGRFGNATRPSAAQSSGGRRDESRDQVAARRLRANRRSGRRRRCRSRRRERNPDARCQARRCAPRHRRGPIMSRSSSSHLKTIL